MGRVVQLRPRPTPRTCKRMVAHVPRDVASILADEARLLQLPLAGVVGYYAARGVEEMVRRRERRERREAHR